MFSATFWQVTTQDKHIQLYGVPINDLLAVFTLLLLVFTIFISIRALLEASRANALSSLPVLRLKYVHDTTRNGSDKVNVENIGNGTALTVRVDKYYQSILDDIFLKQANHYVLKFKALDVLEAGTSAELESSMNKEEGLIDSGILMFKIFNSEEPLLFHIRYKDLSGSGYISKVRIVKNKVEVVGVPKKLNILRKCKYFFYRTKEIARVKFNRMKANGMQKELNQKRNQ